MYDQKIAKARQLLEQHNSTVDEDCQINFDHFLKNLQKAGGTSEDALKAVSWEDLKDCGLPVILARRVSYIFRQEGEESAGKTAWVSQKKAQQMTTVELMERYNPKDSDSSVYERLQKLSKGKKCVVFTNDGKVDVGTSAKLLDDILDGMSEMEIATGQDGPSQVYCIGDRPDHYWDENPLYRGRPLRSGEICDQTNRSWGGISKSIRQLVRLALDEGEIRVLCVADAHSILDYLVKNDTFDEVARRYPKAAVAYKKFEKENKLPLLRISAGASGFKRSNNPFGENATL